MVKIRSLPLLVSALLVSHQRLPLPSTLPYVSYFPLTDTVSLYTTKTSPTSNQNSLSLLEYHSTTVPLSPISAPPSVGPSSSDPEAPGGVLRYTRRPLPQTDRQKFPDPRWPSHFLFRECQISGRTSVIHEPLICPPLSSSDLVSISLLPRRLSLGLSYGTEINRNTEPYLVK